MNEKMYTKSIRRNLREYVRIIHERHLAKALEELHGRFQSWEKGELDSFTLNDYIHQFHQGPSRALYNRFAASSSNLNDIVVAAAIVDGTLNNEEVSPEVREAIAHRIVSVESLREEE